MSLKIPLIEVFFLLAIYKRGETSVGDLTVDLSFEENNFITRKKIWRIGQELKKNEYVLAEKMEKSNLIVYRLTEKGERFVEMIQLYLSLLEGE